MNLNKLSDAFKLSDLNIRKKIFNTLVHNLQTQRYNFNKITQNLSHFKCSRVYKKYRIADLFKMFTFY